MKRNNPVSGLEGATETTENTTTSQVEDNTTEEKPTTDAETTGDDNTDDSGDVDSDPEPDSDETTDSETDTTDDDDGENYGPDDEENTFEKWSFNDFVNNVEDEDEDEEDVDDSEWDNDTTDDTDTEKPHVDAKTQKYIAKLRRENAAYRARYQELRENSMEEIEQHLAESYTTIAKAAQLEGEYNDQTLADAISKQIHEANTRADDAQKELAVYKAAQELEADAEQLMDSVKFTTQLKELNPTDADYQQKVKELVEHATSETNRKTHRITRQGSDMSTGVTEIDPANMTFQQRLEMRRKSRSRGR